MWNHLIYSSLYLSLLFVVYQLIFHGKLSPIWNRAVIIASIVISQLLPFTKLNIEDLLPGSTNEHASTGTEVVIQFRYLLSERQITIQKPSYISRVWASWQVDQYFQFIYSGIRAWRFTRSVSQLCIFVSINKKRKKMVLKKVLAM